MSLRRFIDLLNWERFVAPGVLLCKDGTLLAGWAVTGLDTESMGDAALSGRLAHLAGELAGLGDPHTLWSVFHRQPWQPPEASWGPPETGLLALDMLREETRTLLSGPGMLWSNRLELYLAWRPPPDLVTLEDWLGGFDEECHRFELRLGAVFTVTRLGPDPAGAPEGCAFCTLAGGLTGFFGPARKVAVPLAEAPVAADVLFDLEVRQPEGRHLLQVNGHPTRPVAFTGWPSAYAVAPLEVLQNIAHPFTWVTRYDALSPSSARDEMEWLRKTTSQEAADHTADIIGESRGRRDRFADEMVEEAEEGLKRIARGDDGHGRFTSLLLLQGAPGAAAASLRPAREALVEAAGQSGFKLRVETDNALAAFLSALPGHGAVNRRRVFMNAQSLVDLIPIRSIWQGAPVCPSSKLPPGTPALALARSLGGELVHLNLHDRDVGHTLIFGPTGAGKSVLLGHLVTCWLRYPDARVIFFDKGRSVRHLTAALGGTFLVPGTVDETGTGGLAPLAQMGRLGTDWALGWLTTLAEFSLGKLDVEQVRDLRQAVGNLGRTPGGATLERVREFVQDKALRETLSGWTEGPRAGLFDTDGLDPGTALTRAPLTVFETDPLFEAREDVAVLSLDYIFAEVARLFDGRPTLVVLDEAWSFFDHALFRTRIRDWLKTGRKSNVAVVMATQSIHDAVTNDITPVLLESCPTKIFLPNPEAAAPVISPDYEKLGLDAAAIALIAAIRVKHDYYLRQPGGARVVSFPFGPVAEGLLMRTSTDDSTRADHLARANPDYWLEAFTRDGQSLQTPPKQNGADKTAPEKSSPKTQENRDVPDTRHAAE